jgi:serine/threonine-protein kinase
MSAAGSSRYDTIVKLASGGMATVWVGTVRGALGFRQLVAIKKPHPHLLDDVSYRTELITEARLASLINHANVVDVRDVEVDGESISLVMDYIEGASLGELVVAASMRGIQLPPRVAVRITLDTLAGLHAAHELVDERGRPVGLVHRDISPQNVLVGVDGLARVADFGVAKFARKKSETSDGSLKGKLAYMAPEYLRGEAIDRRFDVFAVGIVLWETLAGKRLFRGANEAETVRLLLEHEPASLASVAPAAAALDGVVATALSRSLDQRFQNAAAMAAALESTALAAGLLGGHTEVAAILKELVGASIEERRTLVRAKLAHEPSLASLMGVPPMPAGSLVDPAPVTVLNAPALTGNVATPKLGSAHADSADAGPATVTMGPSTIVDPPRVVASTLPVVARVDAPGARTLASPGTSDRVDLPAAGISGSTLPSAAPAGDSSPALRGTAETQLSFNEPSARTAHDTSTPMVPQHGMTRAVVGVSVATALVLGGVLLFVTRTKAPAPAAKPEPATAQVAAESSATPSPSPAVVPAGAAASAAPGPAAAAAPSSGAAASSARRLPVRAGGASHPAAAGAAGAASAGPAATEKKPPPNPYANE